MLEYKKDGEGVESLDGCKYGGYHLLHLDDFIPFEHPRYRVILKLGYGIASTVWLAEVHENNLAQEMFGRVR